MVRRASPLLPACSRFAKVPELGSWALAGGRWACDRGRPQRPVRLSAARDSPGAARKQYAGMLQCTLFPALPRDVQTRPAFDLETPRNLCAEGTVRIA